MLALRLVRSRLRCRNSRIDCSKLERVSHTLICEFHLRGLEASQGLSHGMFGHCWGGGAGADLKPAEDATARAERCGVTAATLTLGAYEIAALGRLLAASLTDLISSQ